MFLWGRWRHDMVAVGALLASVLSGLVPAADAFAGFGHPAVVTVACVLVLSRALQSSGAVDALARRVVPASGGLTLAIAALTGLGAALSAFMNNVGALALLMPLAMQVAGRHRLAPGRVLMPLSFGSLLGGMTTLIGTPPNLIVSGFRARTGEGSFAMFDFTWVGLPVAAAGVLFIVLLGWRLVPSRSRSDADRFETRAYLTEARVPDKSPAEGKTLAEVEAVLDEADAQVVGLIRHDIRISAPGRDRKLRAGDILVIQAEPEGLGAALARLGLRLEEDVREGRGEGEEGELAEVVVLPGSTLVGRSATDIRLRTRFGINLLAVSRPGRPSAKRLRTTPMAAGDVLLMQGPPEALAEFVAEFGCVPLAERPLHLPDRRQAMMAGAIMAVAVGAAAFGLLPAAVAFAAGVLATLALGVVSPRKVYEAIDWPVIVLLGALIPVAGAMASTGAADLLARALLDGLAGGRPVIALGVILVVTMTLSDFMNNAATAAVMCPIAIGAAARLGVSADPFLMAVAVVASSAFLTPIGHQNNTLILGPGGFRFGDYWRLGLPLEVVVVGVGLVTLLLAWPL
ncbi:MAG: SLC13 family permease [Candidatus Rokubacteria bacterium]|nr:SLC13 family permease [Candidatus Rokubacteria bacterium]